MKRSLSLASAESLAAFQTATTAPLPPSCLAYNGLSNAYETSNRAAEAIDIAARDAADRAEQRGDTPPTPAEMLRYQPNDEEPLSYAALVGAHGGLTALLHAAREGHEADAYFVANRELDTSSTFLNLLSPMCAGLIAVLLPVRTSPF